MLECSPASVLDFVFGVSCLLMLASICWMFYDDQYRDWKKEQRQFRDVEEAMAQRAVVNMAPDRDQMDAIEAAQKADAVIYSIDYSDPRAYGPFGGGGGGEGELRKMSDETGGHVYKVDRRHSLADIFRELQEEMRSQYSIGYTPLNDVKDGSYRRLEIKLANKDLKAQARKGYYAVKPESR